MVQQTSERSVMHITSQEIEAAVKDRDIAFWPLRDCSICGCKIGYHFARGGVFFDSSCGCSTYDGGWDPRSYDEIADHINRQPNQSYVDKVLDFWKPDHSTKRPSHTEIPDG